MRAPITFLSVTGAGLTVRERLFVVAAWAPKATVQAALAMAPAALIAQAHRSAPYPQWGQEMFVTAIFAIIICASVGVIAVSFLAPRCLHKVQLAQCLGLDACSMQAAPLLRAVKRVSC